MVMATTGRAELTPGTPAPDVASGEPWLNSPPLSMHRELRNRVVLVDFWEYTCINCIRTLPPLKRLYAAYHPLGFEIVGVHAPEFDFAYKAENVARGAKRLQIPWPVVVDSRFTIWHAYDSNSWPNDFLVSAKGVIVDQHAGEGGYAALERKIRDELKKANAHVSLPNPVLPPDSNTFDPARCGETSEETYVGTERGDKWGGAIANAEGFQPGKTVTYKSTPRDVPRGFFARGEWINHGDDFEHARESTPGADYIGMRYQGAEVYPVMNVKHGGAQKVYVERDRKPVPVERRGVDIKADASGRTWIEVEEGRMYYAIQNEDGAKHELRLSPATPGVAINSFTFGNRCLTRFDHL